MVSVAMATLASVCSSAPSSSAPTSSSLLRPASLHPFARFTKESTTFPSFSFEGASNQCSFSYNQTVTHAVAEVLTVEPSVEEEDKPPVDEVSKLKLESDLLKKKAKRAELRWRRLVRKRHLRKKGRWPPSKMAKLKNI